MNKTTLYILTLLAGATLGSGAGMAIGYRLGFVRALGYLENRLAGTLELELEAASSVRVGDKDRALELLDASVDGHILHLVAGRQNAGFLAGDAEHNKDAALSLAKAYRASIPARGADAAAVRSALGAVPAVGRPRLTPALRQLVEGSRN